MIAIVDYGAGNLRSVMNTLEASGAQFQVVRDTKSLSEASKIILPGVGHFGQMMRALDQLELRGALIERIRASVPFLGICLGMQALFEGSDEAPAVAGLGIFPGRAIRFPQELRVPHMGWNQAIPKQDARLFAGFETPPWFYFAHSYYVPESTETAARCTYSLTYSAAIEHQNIFGVQFHPEKSADAGHRLVQSFLEIGNAG